MSSDGTPAADLRETLIAEMLDWAQGRRSHNNEFMRMESGPEDRANTLVKIAAADAQEVMKLSAAIQALPLIEAHAADVAAAARADLAAAVEALCDEWWRKSQQGKTIINDAGIMQEIVTDLRAVLAEHGTAPKGDGI